MSDQTNVGASSLMGEPAVAVPEAPSAADRDAAFATITKLQRDPAFRERYMRRDDATVREVLGAHRTINTGSKTVVNGRDPVEAPAMLGALQSFADIPPGVTKMLEEGQAVSADEQAWAKNAKTRIMADKDWVRRYLDGGVHERQQMTLLNVILTSKTK